MSASMNKHVVPWINRAEFVDVYNKLYSGRTELQQEALDHISVWQMRCESHVPLAVTCSADLIAAQIEHQDGSACHFTETRLRQSHTLALIRFVNFITDRYQKDGSNVAIPIHRIGQEIGIPEWIISLRHEGTHRSLPTLDVLTRGADWALHWLKESFWEKQVPLLKDASHDGVGSEKSRLLRGVSRKPKSYKKIQFQTGETQFPVPAVELMEGDGIHTAAHLFVAFQQIRFQELAGKKFKFDDLETGKEGQEILMELRKLLQLSVDKTLEVLIQPGFLCPSADQLSHMGLDPSRCSDSKIAWVLAIFWRPLLHQINILRATSRVIEELVSIITDESSHWNRMTHIWLGMLVSPYTIAFPSGRSTLLFDHQVAVSELKLLQECLKHPNVFTHDLLKVFASRSNALLTETGVTRLSQLVKIYLKDQACSNGFSGNKSDGCDIDSTGLKERACTEVQVFTVQDLLHNVPETVRTRRTDSKWRLSTEKIAWQHVPVGILPSQQMSGLYHCLLLGGNMNSQRSQAEVMDAQRDSGEVIDGQMDSVIGVLPDSAADSNMTVEGCDVSPVFSWSMDQLDTIQNKLLIL